MGYLVGPGGRVRWGWRLVLFALLVVGGTMLMGGLAYEFVPALRAAGGLTPFGGVSVTLAAALGASWLVVRRLEGAPLAALGLPLDGRAPREAAFGFLVGGSLIAVVVALLAVTGAVTWRAEGASAGRAAAGTWLSATIFLVVGALEEELLFRGYPLQLLARKLGGPAAIGITAIGFALMHVFNPHPDGIALLNIGLAGILLGTAYWRTFSLWFAAGVHLGWNWVMGVAADLPVSGIGHGTPGFGFLDTPGYDAVRHGPAWWSGGAFGPEAGLAVTAVTLVAIVWVARAKGLRRRENDGPARSLAVRSELGKRPSAGQQ